MSTGKRLAKRSILGTRVSAPFDGHYYSGIIQGTKTTNLDIRETLYCVLFDNKVNGRKILLDFKPTQLIGPGFQSITAANLNKGQKVYITHNGREVSGFVDCHNISTDEVFLTVDVSPNFYNNNNSLINQKIQVSRRLEEIRLSESRKSARLLELDTDYSRLACEGQIDQIRRRTNSMSSSVSSSSMSSHIDVPVIQNGRKRRPSNSSDDVMDDCMAAMVLMSLSCSPKSPRLPEGAFSNSWTSGSSWDSLMSTASRTTTPSPPIQPLLSTQTLHPINGVRDVLNNSGSAKIDRTSPFSSVDEGIEMDETVGFGLDDGLIKKKCQRRILFQCTWPGCVHQCDECHQIEKHVRTQHLGRTDLNEENSDHEEEFYYTEIEIDEHSLGSSASNSSMSPVPQSPSASNDGSLQSDGQSPIPSPEAHKFFPSSSAPTWSHLEDHEYQKPPVDFDNKIKVIQFNHEKINSNNIRNESKSLLSNPINIPGIISYTHQYAKSAPLNAVQSPRAGHKYMRLNSNNKSGTTLLQSPNKTSPTKRGRGESRKCRKVYGMDNRDSWCTQCKWKKACSRFTD